MIFIHREVNAQTGEIVDRFYTPEEEAIVLKNQREIANELEIKNKKTTARASALSKLIDLGLTEEEIAAL